MNEKITHPGFRVLRSQGTLNPVIFNDRDRLDPTPPQQRRIKLTKLRRQGNYQQVEEMLHQEIATGPCPVDVLVPSGLYQGMVKQPKNIPREWNPQKIYSIFYNIL